MPAGKTPARRRRTQVPPIGQYLIERLHGLGLRHIFGVPGDYVLQFYKQLEDGPIEVIGTTREDCAGFAADAYARARGLGAVCITYCVGGFNVTNAVAGAYAEKSPVVVISGSPGMAERKKDPLLHHRVREFSTQRDVFAQITCANAVLDDPLVAFREIDRVLAAALRVKRPVYLEIPRDMVGVRPPYPHEPVASEPTSDSHALEEAVAEAADMIGGSKQPVILGGVEVHRFGLQKEMVALAEKTRIPMAATLLGKSVVSEVHPLYLGVYEGAMGRDDVRKVVEGSDCIIMLGTFMSDINLGIYTARLDQGRCIYSTSEETRIRYHHFHDVLLGDFVRDLVAASAESRDRKPPAMPGNTPDPFKARSKAPVTIKRLFEFINAVLDENMAVVCDIGDSLFGAIDLVIQKQTEFMSPAYYTSMGFGVPAAVGVQCANRKLRPLVMVGDGAFQMTGQELSTVVRLGFDPIVVVLNNAGYGTERVLQEGRFNDIHVWQYHRITDLLGGGWGFEVHTEAELQHAFQAALANREGFSLLNVHLDPNDHSPALDRLARRLSKKI